MSAYACAPHRGSEPGVGWNAACQASQLHDVWLLTSRENRDSVTIELDRAPNDRLHVVFIGPGRWTPRKRIRQKPLPFRANIHYYAWQIAAYIVGRRLHREHDFDVVHHVTFARYYSPSLLALLPTRFLWGPVGGGERAPISFWPGFGLRGFAYESVRALVRYAGEWDPLVRATARRSVLARAATPETATRLRKIGARRVEVLQQVGLPVGGLRLNSIQDTYPGSAPSPFFVSAARLLHWKGIHLGLRAFASAAAPNVEYQIVGEGPDRARLEALAAELGIGHRVRFLGELPRSETLLLIASCIALIHPSLHDSGGVVCLEAMALGRPVICLALGGPATLVTPQTGFVISAQRSASCVSDMAAAMRTLAIDPVLAGRLGAKAQLHADEFSSAKRGELLTEAYDRVSARGGDK
jgi:glycosyltransferase involved in cell wall biosynthesis